MGSLNTFQAIANTSSAVTAASAFAIMEDHLISKGYEYIALMFVKNDMPVNNLTPEFGFSNFPKPWRETYAKNNYARIDPNVRMSRKTKTPFYVTESYAKAGQEELEVLEGAEKLDFVEAIIFPFHHVINSLGVVFIGKNEPFKLSKPEETELHTLAKCLFDTIYNLSKTQTKLKSPKLNDRQVKILSLVLQNHTTKDIREKLAISDIAIKMQIQDAGFKLGTKTAKSAALEALKLGLIPKT